MSRSTKSTCHLAVVRRLLLLFLLGSSLSLNLHGQVVGGTIQGMTTDPNGAALPSVKVEIVNLSTQILTTLTSNAEGFYAAPNLLPGEYKVTATRSGFATTVTQLTLTVGAQRVVNMAMKIGTVTEVVKVMSEAPDVELASSEISAVVNSTTIRELPLNGRDWTQLATLQPGITSLRTQPSVGASDRGQRGFGTQMTVNGGRPAQNNYRLDGTSINDYSNSAPGSVLGADLGSDAVAEFSVLSSNYPAEYGRSSGGVINAITRSGTDHFHGTVYEFLRNSALDASNFFDTTKPPFKRNQFGAAAGGPIFKNRTFIFGNYEGLRQSLGITQVNLVPTDTARTGQLSTGNVIVDPAVVPYLTIWPRPNSGVEPTSCIGGICDLGIFKLPGQQITPENYFTTRIDHKASVNDSLYGTYMRDTATISQPDELGTKLTGYTTRRQLVTIEESHIFTPQVVNAARVGYSRVVGLVGQTLKALSPLATDPALGFSSPGRPVGEIDVGGLTNFSGGLGAISNYNFHWNSFQGYDDAFVTSGKHSLKFGLAVERIQENMSAADSPNGIYTFDSLSLFLQGSPTAFAANLGQTGVPRHMRQTILGAYLADDLRLFPNLTVNLGLRYEMATVPTETHGLIATLRDIRGSTLHLGDPYFSNPTLHDFEPRIGFSWDPFKTGKTAVRGGFGMFDVLPLPYETQNLTLFAAPFYLLGTIGGLSQGDFPGAFSKINANDSKSLRVNYIQPNPSRNYVMEWNLNVQRELSPSTAVMIGYIGSRGVHNPFRVEDMNVPLPDITVPQGYVWSAATQGNPVNPTFGQIEGLMWIASSSYHSLQTQIKKNMSHGLQAQASFTWSRSIDSSSAGSIGDNFHNSVSSLPFFDTKLNHGPSDFNIGKNLIANFEWEIPSPKSLFAPAQWALSGWQLGGIFEASSGVPFSVIISGDPLQLGNGDPFARPSRLNGPGCGNPVNPGNPVNYIKLECFGLPMQPPGLAGVCQPFTDPSVPPGTCANLLGNAGRNQLTGPGLINFDLSLFKNMKIKKISENFNAQFRVETFNIFNHPNFSPPLDFNALFDSTGAKLQGAGTIDSTVTTSRQIQVALKLTW
ncbi:MAG TPA: carboxypeptidase regulatory-like domain-containing protein [Terriglobales bacterium]|nr:carboxypeptidase regulatory-like domain-containing protein [Terriglobales bacterium]